MSMEQRQNWHTESYKGMEVHVTALPRGDTGTSWEYTVRIAQPGDDAGSESELTAESGSAAAFPSEEDAVEAGFVKGYAMVDALF
ncbi:MAG TPA: hypothetical protein VGE12_05815 [Noviherbaspirillum sp.]